ncbi:hypothetical protein F4805DRAFT_461356 [Annulohypoxylon moriforme]|nr:hypothetical protein F4805DRAFT_461356 [Annulohypoxylon moriforme]
MRPMDLRELVKQQQCSIAQKGRTDIAGLSNSRNALLSSSGSGWDSVIVGWWFKAVMGAMGVMGVMVVAMMVMDLMVVVGVFRFVPIKRGFYSNDPRSRDMKETVKKLLRNSTVSMFH